LGRTVQVVPHITNAIQDWIARVAKVSVDDLGEEPDVCIGMFLGHCEVQGDMSLTVPSRIGMSLSSAISLKPIPITYLLVYRAALLGTYRP
jgi:hypothetical protein